MAYSKLAAIRLCPPPHTVRYPADSSPNRPRASRDQPRPARRHLAALIVALVREIRRGDVAGRPLHVSLLLVYSVYALASVGREIFHVRSGGAYGSYVLPMSIVVSTYLWVAPFARSLRDAEAARIARRLVRPERVRPGLL